MLNPLPSSPTLATITTNIPHLALVDPVLPLRLYDPRNELPRLRVISLMARSLAAGLVHNWSLHYAPYLGATFNFSACLDRDFIDRLRYCGVTTVWQSIFGALVACISRAWVPSHFAQLLLSVKDHSLHSDPLLPQSPVLSESSPATGSDLRRPGWKRSFRYCGFCLWHPSGLSPFLGWHVFCSASVLHGVFSGSPFWGLRFPQSSFIW